MPLTLIDVRREYSKAEEVAIVDAVHEALVAAFLISPEDKQVRLIVHEPHRFACPPNQPNPDAYTLVTIDIFAGRSIDAKRKLYAEIVDRLSAVGIPREDITIALREVPTENIGIRGGQAASDLELGLKLNV